MSGPRMTRNAGRSSLRRRQVMLSFVVSSGMRKSIILSSTSSGISDNAGRVMAKETHPIAKPRPPFFRQNAFHVYYYISEVYSTVQYTHYVST